MKGQWIGTYSGTTNGEIIINIDDVSDHFVIEAKIFPYDKKVPSTSAYMHTLGKSNRQKNTAYLNPINPRTGFDDVWGEIKHIYPNMNHSETAEVAIHYKKNNLEVKAITNLGYILESNIQKSDSKESKIPSTTLSWSDYKSKISQYINKGYVFRGQKEPWRLRTSFHRHGRFLISRFLNNDVPKLHQHLSALTLNYFDIRDPKQNGALFNLLQHHGYPTPLLDWTHSPFVAAFFAFRKVPKGESKNNKYVRIYTLNIKLWRQIYPQIDNINPNYPHLSVADFIALNNPRVIPQQAITTVTNLDDIEEYLMKKEGQSGEKFIEAIDIPLRYRDEAIKELGFMGITAGSMFPGIDGLCEDLKEKNF